MAWSQQLFDYGEHLAHVDFRSKIATANIINSTLNVADRQNREQNRELTVVEGIKALPAGNEKSPTLED